MACSIAEFEDLKSTLTRQGVEGAMLFSWTTLWRCRQSVLTDDLRGIVIATRVLCSFRCDP